MRALQQMWRISLGGHLTARALGTTAELGSVQTASSDTLNEFARLQCTRKKELDEHLIGHFTR